MTLRYKLRLCRPLNEANGLVMLAAGEVISS